MVNEEEYDDDEKSGKAKYHSSTVGDKAKVGSSKLVTVGSRPTKQHPDY